MSCHEDISAVSGIEPTTLAFLLKPLNYDTSTLVENWKKVRGYFKQAWSLVEIVEFFRRQLVDWAGAEEICLVIGLLDC